MPLPSVWWLFTGSICILAKLWRQKSGTTASTESARNLRVVTRLSIAWGGPPGACPMAWPCPPPGKIWNYRARAPEITFPAFQSRTCRKFEGSFSSSECVHSVHLEPWDWRAVLNEDPLVLMWGFTGRVATKLCPREWGILRVWRQKFQSACKFLW